MTAVVLNCHVAMAAPYLTLVIVMVICNSYLVSHLFRAENCKIRGGRPAACLGASCSADVPTSRPPPPPPSRRPLLHDPVHRHNVRNTVVITLGGSRRWWSQTVGAPCPCEASVRRQHRGSDATILHCSPARFALPWVFTGQDGKCGGEARAWPRENDMFS